MRRQEGIQKPNLWWRALITNEGQMTAGHYGMALQPSYNWRGEKRRSDVNTQNWTLFSSFWPLTWKINNKISSKATCEKQSETDLQCGINLSLLHRRLRCHASSWLEIKMLSAWDFCVGLWVETGNSSVASQNASDVPLSREVTTAPLYCGATQRQPVVQTDGCELMCTT